MTKLLTIIFISIYFPVQGQKVTNIATASKNSYNFLIDTTAYKQNISKELASIGHNVVFNKIEIRKQTTLGSKREFNYLLLTNKDKTIKVARWLVSKGKRFITIDEPGKDDDLFEQLWLTCIGNGDCSPNVLEDKSGRMWGCSDVVGCNAIEGQEPKCITLQSMF